MEVLAEEFGCKVGSLPSTSTYLGLPLGARYNSDGLRSTSGKG